MVPRSFPASCLLALSLLAGPGARAQTPPPLVVALLNPDHGLQVGGRRVAQRILHPAFVGTSQGWRGLDESLTPEAATKAGLPPFTVWSRPGALAAPQRVSLGDLVGAFYGLSTEALSRWHRPGFPDLRALGGLQTHWGCEAGWGLEVDDLPGGAGLQVVTNQPLPVVPFVAVPPEGLGGPGWEAVWAAWQKDEARALAVWKAQDERDPWRGVPRQAAARAGVPLQDPVLREARDGRGRRLLHVTALRPYGVAREGSPECKAPVAVMSALLVEEAGKPIRVLRARMEFQDCGEGWVPMPHDRPFALFTWEGVCHLIQMDLGLESESFSLYRIDPVEGLSERLASGATSGC